MAGLPATNGYIKTVTHPSKDEIGHMASFEASHVARSKKERDWLLLGRALREAFRSTLLQHKFFHPTKESVQIRFSTNPHVRNPECLAFEFAVAIRDFHLKLG